MSENTKHYEAIKVNGVTYVIVGIERDSSNHALPNFMGQEKALAGILPKGQTLEDFIKSRPLKWSEAEIRAEQTLREFNTLSKRRKQNNGKTTKRTQQC